MALHTGVVGLPFHAGQCGLEGAGDIRYTKLPKFRHSGCISREPLTCWNWDSNPGPSGWESGSLTTRPPRPTSSHSYGIYKELLMM